MSIGINPIPPAPVKTGGIDLKRSKRSGAPTGTPPQDAPKQGGGAKRRDASDELHAKQGVKQLKEPFFNPKARGEIEERLRHLDSYDPAPPAGGLLPAVFDPTAPDDPVDPDVLAAIHDSPRAQYARSLEAAHAIAQVVASVNLIGTASVVSSFADTLAGAAAATASAPDPNDDSHHGGRRPPG